ncbi:hypothetical protein BDZ91DRAFT_744164 [Kalaharituber pfeilii]|nr:hypothetical protein BDZ91DRAFT_744164 [Kalaharituber pfeilii]
MDRWMLDLDLNFSCSLHFPCSSCVSVCRLCEGVSFVFLLPFIFIFILLSLSLLFIYLFIFIFIFML